MLDTRKIYNFVNPQFHIDLCNSMSDEVLLFSPWDKNSNNIVMSHLLKDHIHTCLNEKGNFVKMRDTMEKLGLPTGNKLLLLDSETCSLMTYEAFPDNKLMIHSSRIINGVVELNFATIVQLFPEHDDTVWFCNTGGTLVDKRLADQSKFDMEKWVTTGVKIMIGFYIYLHLVEVETVYVQPKEKFKAKKYEGFKNQQNVPIKVADIGWARETILNLPFGVSGHLRSQPIGPGRKERKLIHIEPYMKSGMVRKSGKDRILKSQP